MVDISKPVYGSIWANAGEKLPPDQNKIAMGWIQEMMPYQYENYLQNRTDVALSYLLQKGIAEWSADQEYTANKSVVTYGGQLYMATSTVTNTLPTVAASWKKLSATFGVNGAIPVTFGGTGATTAADARTNLGIGSAATVNLPTSNGLVAKLADNSLVARAVTGITGYITVTNGDAVAGNPVITVGENVAKTDADAAWTTKTSIKVPSGTSSERGVGAPGRIRFNMESGVYEGYDNVGWNPIGSTGTLDVQNFSGDGVKTSFTMSATPRAENNTQVYFNGVYQQKNSYNLVGSNLVFDEAPLLGIEIEVVTVSSVAIGTTTAGQTSIVDSGNYYNSTNVEGALAEVGNKQSHTILSYPTKAEAESAAVNLSDGQVVQDSEYQYTVQGGVLVFVKTLSDKNQPINPMQFGGIWDGVFDNTEAIRKAHTHANIVGASVTYSGIKLFALQADAKIPLQTNTYFENAEAVILGGVNPSPTFTSFNSLFIVSDPDTPILTTSGAVSSANLAEGSLFPTLGLFEGHGFALLTAGLKVPNRAKTGTMDYTQSFKVNRKGRCSLPLSVDLTAYASNISIEYRLTSKRRLEIKGFTTTEGDWNNQRLFRVERCNVSIDGLSVPFTRSGTYNNICQLISVYRASDVFIDGYITSGRPVSTTSGSYCLEVSGGADIYVNNMNAVTGWGAVGTNDVNGLHFYRSVLNRIDAHSSGHNITADDCDLHEAGMVFGWGGGVWSLKNSRTHRCSGIATREDYGGTFFGSIIVSDCEVEHNTTSTYRLIDLETNPLGASTEVFSPASITVDNVKRTGKASTNNAEFIPVAIKIVNASSIVYAPVSLQVSGISSSFPSWRIGMRLDTLNMESSPQTITTTIEVREVYPGSAATSTTGIIEFDSIRTPTTPVRPLMVISDANNIHIRNRAAANLEIQLNSVGVNGVMVNTESATQPVVVLNACKLRTSASGYTSAPIGGSNSGTSAGYTILNNCEIYNSSFDLSLLSAAIGNVIRNPGTSVTLPSGVTAAQMFTGYRKAGVFA